MIRYDGQGFHPTIRPFIPHRKKERNKIKVTSIVSPKAWQLAMMRLGINFASDKGNPIRLINLIDSDETLLLAPICGGIISCGAAGDYCAVQANPSRPPPDMAFQQKIGNAVINDNSSAKTQTPACNRSLIDRLQKFLLFRILLVPLFGLGFNMKFKVPYNIKKSLIRILPFAAAAIMATSCNKKYDSVIEWDWSIEREWAPPKETVEAETNNRDVENVFIKLTYANCSGVSPMLFHRARDTLQTRINIDPNKVKLAGKIFVNPQTGAHLPQNYEPGQCGGMSLEDSIWYTQNGCTVQRLPYYNNSH